MGFRLNEMEMKCVKLLAEMFERGEVHVEANLSDLVAGDQPDVTPQKRAAVLETMQSIGVIEDAVDLGHVRYASFTITPKVVQVARAIDAELKERSEPEDIVEKITTAARNRPVIAWLIVGFLVLTAIATLVNQTIQILQNFRVIPKP